MKKNIVLFLLVCMAIMMENASMANPQPVTTDTYRVPSLVNTSVPTRSVGTSRLGVLFYETVYYVHGKFSRFGGPAFSGLLSTI